MHFKQTADSNNFSTYQVSAVQLVTDKCLSLLFAQNASLAL